MPVDEIWRGLLEEKVDRLMPTLGSQHLAAIRGFQEPSTGLHDRVMRMDTKLLINSVETMLNHKNRWRHTLTVKMRRSRAATEVRLMAMAMMLIG